MKINEGIGLDVKNDGTQNINQDTLDYYTDIYNPGQIKERLRVGIEVDKNGLGNFKIGYFTFNTTGNLSITGLGFKPKLVIFNYTNQAGVIGNGAMDGTSQYGYEDNLGTQIQTECIYIRNSSGAAIGRAVYVSMDNDGFTINKTLASTTIYVNWIAFG